MRLSALMRVITLESENVSHTSVHEAKISMTETIKELHGAPLRSWRADGSDCFDLVMGTNSGDDFAGW